MKCKDIPDKPILEFLWKHRGRSATWSGYGISMPNVADAMPIGTPPKLPLAKMRMLIRRGLVDGCPCGCRGDFVITAKGAIELGFYADVATGKLCRMTESGILEVVE